MLRIAFAVLVFVSTASAEQHLLNKFTGGLNTKISPILLPEGSTPDCQNVLFDDTGGVKKRKGYKYIGYSTSTTVGTKLFPLARASGAKFLFKQAEDELWVSVTGADGSWTLLRSDLRWQVNNLNSAVISNDRWFANGIDYIFSSNGRTYDEYTFIPKGKFITSKAEGSSGILYDRVFVANTYDYPSGVSYSDLAYAPTDSDAWSDLQIFLVGASDGEVITGLYVWKGDLYIFKTRSVWRLAGNSPDNWVLRRLTREYGCAEQGTIKEYKNILVFLSNEKRAVVGFDGSFFKELSEPIEPDLDNWDNLDGYYNYWIQTVQSDFTAGKSTGLTVSDYLVLEDVSKVWSSSATYPTAFSSGTYSNTSYSVGVKLDDITTSISSESSDYIVDMFMAKVDAHPDNIGTEHIIYTNPSHIYEDDNKNATTDEWVTNIINFPWQRYYGSGAIIDISLTDGIYTKISFKDIGYKFNWQTPSADAKAYNLYCSGHYQAYIYYMNLSTNKYQLVTYPSLGYTDRIYANDTSLTKFVSKSRDVIFTPVETNAFRIIIMAQYSSPWGISGLRATITPINAILVYEKDEAAFEYETSGTFKTEEYDWEGQVYLSTATFDVTSYDYWGTTITHLIRSKLTDWTTYYPISDGQAIPSQLSPCQYVEVLSSFTTIYSSYTPTLHSIEVGAVKSTGSWESDWFQADKVTGWKYGIFDDETPSDTGISYAVRTASSTANQSSASWDWLSSGDLLDAGVHPSSHTYIQVKSTMATTNGIRSPTMFSTTFLWYPESEPIRPCSGIVDKRYWLGISTTSAEYNDNIYILDKNMAWTRYSGYFPSDIVNWKNETYVLDGSSTAIWQVNYGNADKWCSAASSSTISSYWTSKPLFLSLDRETTLKLLYASFGATGGDIAAGFALYPDAFTEYTVSLSGSREINDRKGVDTGEMGKIWQFRIYDDSSEAAFQFNNLTIFYKIKPLR